MHLAHVPRRRTGGGQADEDEVGRQLELLVRRVHRVLQRLTCSNPQMGPGHVHIT